MGLSLLEAIQKFREEFGRSPTEVEKEDVVHRAVHRPTQDQLPIVIGLEGGDFKDITRANHRERVNHLLSAVGTYERYLKQYKKGFRPKEKDLPDYCADFLRQRGNLRALIRLAKRNGEVVDSRLETMIRQYNYWISGEELPTSMEGQDAEDTEVRCINQNGTSTGSSSLINAGAAAVTTVPTSVTPEFLSIPGPSRSTSRGTDDGSEGQVPEHEGTYRPPARAQNPLDWSHPDSALGARLRPIQERPHWEAPKDDTAFELAKLRSKITALEEERRRFEHERKDWEERRIHQEQREQIHLDDLCHDEVVPRQREGNEAIARSRLIPTDPQGEVRIQVAPVPIRPQVIQDTGAQPAQVQHLQEHHQSQTQGVRDADTLRAEIQLMRELMRECRIDQTPDYEPRRRYHLVEVEKFDGKEDDYPTFRQTIILSISRERYEDEKDKALFLLKHLKGVVRDHLIHLTEPLTNESFNAMMTLLDRTYGDEDERNAKVIAKLDRLPKLTELTKEAILHIESVVNGAAAALQIVDPTATTNPYGEKYLKIIGTLPRHERDDFISFCRTEREVANIKSLMNFLTVKLQARKIDKILAARERPRAARAAPTQSTRPVRKENKGLRVNRPTYRTLEEEASGDQGEELEAYIESTDEDNEDHLYAVGDPVKNRLLEKRAPSRDKTQTGNKPSSRIRTPPGCPLCKREHYVQDCEEFKVLSPRGRRQSVDHHKMCSGCLQQGHYVKSCRLRKVCGLPGCTKKHHPLLHDEKLLRYYSSLMMESQETTPIEAID